MTLFASFDAWNSAALDFNRPIREFLTAGEVAGGEFTNTFPPFKIDDVRYRVGTLSLFLESTHFISWGDDGQESFVSGSDLEVSTLGDLIGGTAQFISEEISGVLSFAAVGFSIDAAEIVAARTTFSNTDDIAVLDQILAGNDLVGLSGSRDVFLAGSGHDLIDSGKGADQVFAGTGNDIVLGGQGNDAITGDAGNDVLFGDDGNDRLIGSDGNDLLGGGAGNDTLTGGRGADRFVFITSGGSGTDTITDFDGVTDRIIIRSNAIRFGDLTLRQDGTDVLVALGRVTLRLEDVDRADLTARDFGFDANGLIDSTVARFFNGWEFTV